MTLIIGQGKIQQQKHTRQKGDSFFEDVADCSRYSYFKAFSFSLKGLNRELIFWTKPIKEN